MAQPTVKDGTLVRYHVSPAAVRYGSGSDAPLTFGQGRFPRYNSDVDSVVYGSTGGVVIRMDQGDPGQVRYGTGI